MILAIAAAALSLFGGQPQHPTVTRTGWFYNEIATYYAQRPMEVTFTDTTSSAYTDGFGHAYLGRVAQQKLAWLVRYARTPQGPKGGVLGIMSLIHEAIHNRDFGTPSPFDPLSQNPVTGYYSGTNERQAGIMGCQLIPDAMERFFGVPQDSKLGREYARLAEECMTPWLNRENG